MAKFDNNSPYTVKTPRKVRGDLEFGSLSKYHYLASVRNLTTTPDLKKKLVYNSPEVAAQVFYHFDDREIGNLIVTKYTKDFDAKLRELAFGVKDVLHARNSTKSSLDSVLGIDPLYLLAEEPDDGLLTEGFLDNGLRAFEA